MIPIVPEWTGDENDGWIGTSCIESLCRSLCICISHDWYDYVWKNMNGMDGLLCIYEKCCGHDWYVLCWCVNCWILCLVIEVWSCMVWWEYLCMCIVMFLHTCTQWYYNPVSHPSAVFECSMRHCRLDCWRSFVEIVSSFFCRSALICSIGLSGGSFCDYVYIYLFFLDCIWMMMYITDKLYIYTWVFQL